MDVDTYFSHIGYVGPRTATLAVLRTVIARHVQTIPFESLNPFAQLPVKLDIASLQEKIVRGQRGGYCFEQNLLLWNVLRQMGFDVTGLAARVSWNAPPDAVLPRTHMLLLVKIDGASHLVDVGFGGLTLTGVLRLEADVEQATPHEPFRLTRAGDQWTLQARIRNEWRSLYYFDLQPQFPVDYEPVNWYLSTFPNSRFVVNLIAARCTPDRRHALFNLELAEHPLGGETQRRTLASVDELRRVLAEIFLIRIPESAQVDAALARLFRNA